VSVLICADEVEARATAADPRYDGWLRISVGSLTAREHLRGRMVGRIVVTPDSFTRLGWQRTLDLARDRRPISWSAPARDQYERIQ
jgi:hypothetical protein